MRVIALLIAMCMVGTAGAQAATLQRKVVVVQRQAPQQQIARQDPNFSPDKYAALIMDARTGEVLHARNADAKRYPASLTKMMTLYLLFEALDAKKTTLKSTMLASRNASQQPQTNISLKPGERIPVDTAIRALVVRSANDVAVVTAEYLGKSVPNFAQMMTNKARVLGMRNTVFKNPHGLPDYNQYTTARDMAKLGVALRRDFPQYYAYFAVRQFTWKRVPYYTHNRVMLRYTGADGLKTGFINMSGFNVVTSVKSNGRNLIGVVLGGNNSTARDDRMIALLGNAQKTLAARGNAIANMQPRNLPSPRVADSAGRPVIVPAQPVAVAQDRGIIKAATQQANMVTTAVAPSVTVNNAALPPTPKAPETVVPVQIALATPVILQPAPQPVATAVLPAKLPFSTMSASNVPLSRPMNDVEINRWGIQVGAYEDRTQAEQAVQKAVSIASSALQGSRMAVLGSDAANKTIHRARLENLTEDQARKACQALISNQSPCFIYRAN